MDPQMNANALVSLGCAARTPTINDTIGNGAHGAPYGYYE